MFLYLNIKSKIFNEKMKKKLKVAFIGGGRTGVEHIKAFKSLDQKIKLVSVCTQTKKSGVKVTKKFKIEKNYTSIKEMYVENKPDLVVVCVPIIKLKKIFKEVVKYKWKILFEKPLGINLEETLYLLRQIKDKNQIALALNRNNYCSTLEIQKIISRDKSERVITIEDQQNVKNLKKTPLLIKNNYMFANSIHLVDYCRIFARGRVLSIQNLFFKKNKEKVWSIKKLKYSSGDIVFFHIKWNLLGPWSLSISTKKFFFECRPLESLNYQSDKGKKLTKNYKLDQKFKPGFFNQAKEAIKFVKNQKNNLPNYKDILYTTKLIKKLYREI